jgi:DNA repair photolyase
MTVIYAPKGQAGEYAALATNPYRGCGHKCAYCWVPRIPGQPDRKTFDEGATLKPGYLERLEKDARKYQATGVAGQVLLCFSTDPYHPGDTAPTRRAIEILQSHGLAVCTLTKGGLRALRDIDLFRANRDAFASTLTSLDAAFSRKWERAAADPDDRIATLRAFHERGIFTWVSLEPTLDVEHSLAIVDATHEVVDLYKVGRANYLGPITKTTDWRDYTLRMIERLGRYGVKHYIKLDLQPYLPAGYPNPLRVAQHR